MIADLESGLKIVEFIEGMDERNYYNYPLYLKSITNSKSTNATFLSKLYVESKLIVVFSNLEEKNEVVKFYLNKL